MKLLTLLAFILISNARADVCKFKDTVTLDEAAAAGKITRLKVSSDHQSFTSQEKQMIKLAMNATSGPYTLEEALREFGDYYGGETEPGSNSGSIEYFLVKGKKIALVHYYPGDTEVSAIFGIKAANIVTYLASNGDGEITCER